MALTRGRRALAAVVAAAAAFWLPGLVIFAHPRDYLGGLGFLGSNAFARESSVPIGWIEIPIVIWPFGLGLGVFAAAIAGGVVAAFRRRRVDMALLALIGSYYLVTGASHENFFRYQLPMLPALAVLAGGLVRVVPARALAPAVVAAALLLAPSLYASVAEDRLLGVTDTRRLAAPRANGGSR